MALASSVFLGLAFATAVAVPLPRLAPKKDVAAIVGEFEVPSLHTARDQPPPLDELAYPDVILKEYRADVSLDAIRNPENADKYRLRLAVLDAVRTLRDLWGKEWLVIRKEMTLPNTQEFKRQIAEEQLVPARAILKLEAVFDQLDAVEKLRGQETKRWQANYDLTLARCLSRLAFLHEYNLMLAHIRTENLPDLDPAKGEDSWRLVSVEGLRSNLSVKKQAERAAKVFDRVIEDRKGTPWYVAATREKAAPLGLRWEPCSSKRKD